MELQGVLEAYRAMEPVRRLIQNIKTQFEHEQQWASLEFQAHVVHFVVNDPICTEFPPQRTYTYRFLKSFVSEIEALQMDIEDTLVAALMEFVLNKKLLDDSLYAEAMHYVSYTVPTSANTSVVVTCRVASLLNDVGLKIWEAGWLLAEYVLAHEHDFRNKTVLELGAGVGFTGMVLACVCRSSHVVLTDYAPNVLQNLRYNVEINSTKFVCPIEVQVLDWGAWQPKTDDADGKHPDMLLAGDCVYDVEAFPAMMHALQSFFGEDGGCKDSQQSQRVAIFAATVRNQKTFQVFLDQLAEHHINYVDTTTCLTKKTEKQIFSYSNRDQIRICRLSRADLDMSVELKN